MARNMTVGSGPAEVFPPGEFIREECEARGWTQKDLGQILDRPLQVINEIINGKKEVTPETAIALGKAFGTSPELWLNLESAYRLGKAKAKDCDSNVARRARIRSLAPVAELRKRGWIRNVSSPDELESEVCRFLELRSITDEPKVLMAARRGDGYGALSAGQIAWAFRAKHLASELRVPRFDRERFEVQARTLVRLSCDPDGARKAMSALANVGVRVVIVPHLPQTRIDGAAFWLNKDEPVAALSLRYGRIDSFWFTLMHELAHIEQGHTLEGALDSDLVEGPDASPKEKPKYEKEADNLAGNWLIPDAEWRRFIRTHRRFFSEAHIRELAGRLGIHPGIVVGRLHYTGKMPYANLRRMLGKVSGLPETNGRTVAA